jgi:hypothetical protein
MPAPQRGGQQVFNPAERAIATDTARYQSAMNDFMAAQQRTPPAATQTQLSAAAAQGQRVPANVAAAAQADAAKALQGFNAANAQRMGQGMGSQSVSPTQANTMGSMGAGVLGSMRPPAFKKGGMVNAKKKSPASAGKSSSVRPRGSSGKGVKACKVC